MIDPKFYEIKSNIKASYICEFLGLSGDCFIGGDITIDNIAPLNEAKKSDLSFCENANDSLLEAQAGIILMSAKDFEKYSPKNNIIIGFNQGIVRDNGVLNETNNILFNNTTVLCTGL